MDKLQKVKVVLPESEEWFRGIFNQILGFIGLMEPIGIFMEGNQAALEFAANRQQQSNLLSFVGRLLV
ncbi:hypothetical protein [Nostoc sp.]|uniref:hypothetical protein n=1 Tax=Nostoc sp. TaxID=1180 RepID=UPI002FF9406F